MSDSRKIYTYGNAIEISVTLTTSTGVLVNAQNGVKITIINPLGVKVTDSQSMSTTATGVYTYDLQTTKLFTLGTYTCEIAVDGISWDALYISNRIFELVSYNE